MSSGWCSRSRPSRPRSRTRARDAVGRSMSASRTSWRGARMASWAMRLISPHVGTGISTAGRWHDMEIRGPMQLPARREEIELETLDGLTLVGELALPETGEPVATLVTLHPLPTAGGFMDSHILRKASGRLPALADLAVLRFNTRGTTSPRGTSQGAFDGGRAEAFDVAAAMDFVHARGLPRPWLLGWSFGTELALKYGRDHVIGGRRAAVAAAAPRDRRGARRVGGRRPAPDRAGSRVRRLPATGCRGPALRQRAGRGADPRRRREAPVGGREPDTPGADRDRRRRQP